MRATRGRNLLSVGLLVGMVASVLFSPQTVWGAHPCEKDDTRCWEERDKQQTLHAQMHEKETAPPTMGPCGKDDTRCWEIRAEQQAAPTQAAAAAAAVSEEAKKHQAEAWRRAMEGEAKRQAAEEAEAEAAQPSRQEEWQQEDEWQQATDKATGKAYYYNQLTGETAWTTQEVDVFRKRSDSEKDAARRAHIRADKRDESCRQDTGGSAHKLSKEVHDKEFERVMNTNYAKEEVHDKELERVRAETAEAPAHADEPHADEPHADESGDSSSTSEQQVDSGVVEGLNRLAKLAGMGSSAPYEVLGVPVTASRAEIKKAYRKLSLMLHPDKIKEKALKDLASNVFIDIVAAHEVLSNEDNRQAFDDLGDADGTKKETFNTYADYQKFGKHKTKQNNDFFQGHPIIVNLHSSFWERRVAGASIWLVDFYAPWCSHCVTLVPAFKQVAEKLETYESIQIGAFNCEKDKPFCQSFGVNGYPTLALLTSKDTGLFEFYPRGAAKGAEEIATWAKDKAEEWKWLLADASQLPMPLTEASFLRQVVESLDQWVVVYLQNKLSASKNVPGWAVHTLSLAAELRGMARVGIVDCASQSTLCSKHHVEKSVKGELRYFRSGQKACSGLEYFGELVANFNEIEVREALLMTSRLVPILASASSTSDPCSSLADVPPQRASWSGGSRPPPRFVPVGGGGGGHRAGIGR